MYLIVLILLKSIILILLLEKLTILRMSEGLILD